MPVFGIDLPKLLLLPCFCTAGMVGARREKPSAVVAETAEGSLHYDLDRRTVVVVPRAETS